MTPEEAAIAFRESVIEFMNLFAAVGLAMAVLLAIIAGVALVKAVWS